MALHPSSHLDLHSISCSLYHTLTYHSLLFFPLIDSHPLSPRPLSSSHISNLCLVSHLIYINHSRMDLFPFASYSFTFTTLSPSSLLIYYLPSPPVLSLPPHLIPYFPTYHLYLFHHIFTTLQFMHL